MAAGDRNKSGKPKDFVRHYGNQKNHNKDYLLAICGNKRAGYVTDDIHDVTCVKCTCKMLDMAVEIKERYKGLFPNPNK